MACSGTALLCSFPAPASAYSCPKLFHRQIQRDLVEDELNDLNHVNILGVGLNFKKYVPNKYREVVQVSIYTISKVHKNSPRDDNKVRGHDMKIANKLPESMPHL
jgi:hypothetical protein